MKKTYCCTERTENKMDQNLNTGLDLLSAYSSFCAHIVTSKAQSLFNKYPLHSFSCLVFHNAITPELVTEILS